MLAYAGKRPIEDGGRTWGDLHDRTLHVFATSTGRARDLDLIAPLAHGLAEPAHGPAAARETTT
jgi:hypothetical protein